MYSNYKEILKIGWIISILETIYFHFTLFSHYKVLRINGSYSNKIFKIVFFQDYMYG